MNQDRITAALADHHRIDRTDSKAGATSRANGSESRRRGIAHRDIAQRDIAQRGIMPANIARQSAVRAEDRDRTQSPNHA